MPGELSAPPHNAQAENECYLLPFDEWRASEILVIAHEDWREVYHRNERNGSQQP